MEVSLPVWTIRPNWKTGITERLGWLTDVLSTDTGYEQRRAVRLSPRRSFEFTVNPTNAERTFLDLVLQRLVGREWLIPLWHDQGALSAPVRIGTKIIPFDTNNREFRKDDYAIIYKSAFLWEVVKVATITGSGITTTLPIDKAWGRKTRIFPLRKMFIDEQSKLSALTARVGESVVLVHVNEANDYPEMSIGEMLDYKKTPLVTREPNRSQIITTDHIRKIDTQDGMIGLVNKTDKAGRAFAVQSHNWQVTGRRDQAAFRRMLYYLRGRQRMMYLPTFNHDLTIARSAAIGAVRVDVDMCGLTYVGGGVPVPGRDLVWTGKEIVQLRTISGPPGSETERLALRGPLGNAYRAGDTWSFVQPVRLNQDEIEILHHTDSDGTFEVAATFIAFQDGRNPYDPVDQELTAQSTAWRYLRIALDDLTEDRAAVRYDDTGWDCSVGPFGNTGQPVEIPEFAGAWFRAVLRGDVTSFNLTTDDGGDIFYNGVLIDTTVANTPKLVELPADGKNAVIAIRVRDTAGRYFLFTDDLEHMECPDVV